MNAFQMGRIFILHLGNNTIMHLVKNIHAINPRKYLFCSHIYIKKTTMLFQSAPLN
jgi:hypothetical protein